MKAIAAKASSKLLTALAKKFAFTASVFYFHRPETPSELFDK